MKIHELIMRYTIHKGLDKNDQYDINMERNKQVYKFITRNTVYRDLGKK